MWGCGGRDAEGGSRLHTEEVVAGGGRVWGNSEMAAKGGINENSRILFQFVCSLVR